MSRISGNVAISARAIISLEGLSEQLKRDVLESLLLAQLVANKAHAPDEDIEDWCGSFNAPLEKVGWIVQEFRTNPVQSVRSTDTAEDIVLDQIARLGGDLDQYQQDLLWSSIKAVQASPGPAASPSVVILQPFPADLRASSFLWGRFRRKRQVANFHRELQNYATQ